MKDRERLLIVTPSLSSGGAERFVSSLAMGLDSARYELHFVLLREQLGYPIPPGSQVTVLDKRRPWHIGRTIRRLRAVMERWEPSVALGNLSFTSWLLSEASRSLCKRPRLVARFGVSPIHEYPMIVSSLARWAYRASLLRVHNWVANSTQLASLLAKFYGVESCRINTIYTPVDFHELESNKRRATDPGSQPLIVSAGRLAHQKRFDILLRAFQQARTSVSARLVIYGEGPLKSTLMRQVKRLGVAEAVTICPFMPSRVEWLREADIFAMSSDYEGMPNALIEAQAFGLPTVSTNCPTGPSELILEGETGYLVPRRDSATLADRLVRLATNRQLCRRLGTNAATRVRELFHESHTLKRWDRLLSCESEG